MDPFLLPTYNMYSIICPTMWRSPAIDIMINQQRMLDNPNVGEFLLIDNYPNTARRLDHPKIKTIYSGPNVYVNPAWNFGVQQAKFDQICLFSDDTIFDPDVFNQISPTPEQGVIGLGPKCFIGESGNITTRKLITTPTTEPNIKYPRDFGMLVLFHKAAYFPIPDSLKIFIGDLWIYAFNALIRKKPNYYIDNLDLITKLSTTSNAVDMSQQKIKEGQIAERVFADAFGPGIFTFKSS